MLPPIEPGIENPGRIGRIGQNPNSEISFCCEICKSEIFWIPRKSSAIKCWTCTPPSTLAIVAQTNADDHDGTDAKEHTQDASVVPKLCAWTVLYERPVCRNCYSSHVDEIWDENGMRMRCSCCKKKIESENDFLHAIEKTKNSMYALTQKKSWVPSEK